MKMQYPEFFGEPSDRIPAPNMLLSFFPQYLQYKRELLATAAALVEY